MSLQKNIGAEISLENVGEELLSETPGRVLIAVLPEHSQAVSELARSKKVLMRKIGKTGGTSLKFNALTISLDELSNAYKSTFRRLFG